MPREIQKMAFAVLIFSEGFEIGNMESVPSPITRLWCGKTKLIEVWRKYLDSRVDRARRAQTGQMILIV